MKIAIIGHFAKWDKNIVDGQTTKTRNLFYLLKKEMEISSIDTFNWKKHPLSLIRQIIKHCKEGYSFIILPASNGVKIFPRLLLLFKRKYKNIKIYYSVIGGWLPKLLKSNKRLTKTISKLNGVWVETKTMEKQLIELGLENVSLINNYKDLAPLSQNDFHSNTTMKTPHFIIFSRICEKKGVSDAIIAIKNVIKELKIDIKLDIYGPISNEYKKDFNTLLSSSDFVSYKGIVDSNKSVDIIKNYYMLIFPTKFYTEGTPGTIIDAFFAGVPVIASKWESYLDVINNETSITYEFNSLNGLTESIKFAISNTEMIISMKENCLREAQKYTKEEILKQIETALKN